MCGRYAVTLPPDAIRKLFRVQGVLPNLGPRWNAAPTQKLPVIRLSEEKKRELALLRWGLVPSWSKGPEHGYSMINARVESVAEKPSFKTLLKSRRCLVVADGFYEWKQIAPKKKQPYFISLKDGSPMALAGLWDRWQAKDTSETIDSFTIIVSPANDVIAPIHDRMPVILSNEGQELWFDSTQPQEKLRGLLVPYPSSALQAYLVSTRVGNPRNDDAELVRPLGQEAVKSIQAKKAL